MFPVEPEYLPYAHGQPALKGVLRQELEDFVVEETLSFELTGQGEHVYLFIEKRDTNTAWLAKQIAKLAGVRSHDVGYAGLKDKRAVTRQWFSVYLPAGDEPAWDAIETDNIRLLKQTRHRAKLRRGAISANHFMLAVRALEGDISSIRKKLEIVKALGVPNYFTEQRFGRDNNNIQQAINLFAGKLKLRDRQKKGLLYSAALSWLFNQVLAERVATQCWNKALSGDVMMLDGSKRFFSTINEDDNTLQKRLDEFDIHPTGVLWGKGTPDSAQQARELEQRIIDRYLELKQGLEKSGLKQARRSLRLLPRGMQWQLDQAEGALQLVFSLESGGYATAVVRELVNYVNF